MIKKQELLDAIAECQGERNPNANTCIKLAAYYTILKSMNTESDIIPEHSFAVEPSETVMYDSGSEFSSVIYGIDMDYVLSVMDELMDALQVLAPKLYRATIDKLKE